ncbi:cupin domain-containing protein [Minwuia sp.]|uniref:cupin domain-containing protein n=1 Tax=Minwuia sp. TaxID=2493630 RepID=UPI003A8E1040
MADTTNTKRRTPGVYAYAGADLDWVDSNKPGTQLAGVRMDKEAGLFLGYLSFERFAQTGLHHHLGPASSYVMQGALTDYQGPTVAGQCGINLKGATHNAIAYEPSLLCARLDAPVIYLDAEEADEGVPVHTGAVSGEITNPNPEAMPEVHVTVADVPWLATAAAGVVRRNLWNYDTTGMDRRLRQIQMLPGTSLPPLKLGGLTDIFLMSGDLNVSGEIGRNGDFFVLEAGTTVEIGTRYGALMFVWAEGPGAWVDDETKPDLWGF